MFCFVKYKIYISLIYSFIQTNFLSIPTEVKLFGENERLLFNIQIEAFKNNVIHNSKSQGFISGMHYSVLLAGKKNSGHVRGPKLICFYINKQDFGLCGPHLARGPYVAHQDQGSEMIIFDSILTNLK